MNFIKTIQTNFDNWKPPRFIKDNVTRGREFIKNMDKNKIYIVEDKGPSFTKMTKDQYLKAGEKELENPRFYEPIDIEDDKCETLKAKSDKLVNDMFLGNEISEPVAKYLKGGGKNLPKYYPF